MGNGGGEDCQYVQPCFVGSRLGRSGSRECSQMANCRLARFAFSANASEVGGSE